jgi:hypothetical protein
MMYVPTGAPKDGVWIVCFTNFQVLSSYSFIYHSSVIVAVM